MSIPATGNLKQAAGLTRYDWLRGVVGDQRIAVVHRLALVKLALHRRNDFSAVAVEIGLDHRTVLAAVDAARRRGWVAGSPKHSGLLFMARAVCWGTA